MGINKRTLLRTRHGLRSVNGRGVFILGSIVADLSNGMEKATEIVYICDNVENMYLSQTALKKLKLLPKDFPHSNCSEVSATNFDSASPKAAGQAPCGCPTRTPCPEIPNEIPFPATSEHREALEKWILDYFRTSAFNTCEHQQLQHMTGDPLKIAFLPDAQPVAVHKPIPVPHHWKHEVKSQLDADVALGIIEPVPTGTPTTWCSRMVTVSKKDGKPRRTVDLQNLNSSTRRETHHTPTPFHLVSMVPRGKRKTVLDAWNGYHSVPLSTEARDATTFITEWGRFRYLRAPQGFHASGDGYTKRFDDITRDYPRVTRIVDDSLLWDDDLAAAFWHTVNYIKLCGDNGIVFKPSKFKFAMEEVEYAGFDLTLDGYKPTEKFLHAIKTFPTPTNLTSIRSWFGLINQVAYAFAQAPIMEPFRELLKHNSKFYWDDSLDRLFKDSKHEILEKIKDGVKTFQLGKETCLTTDWSKTGIGFTLTQKQCSCPLVDPLCGEGHWDVVYAGSRFTSPAEQRYAPIEGEALALLFGLESCHMFTMGCPNLTIAVDHKPLVRIFNNRDLHEIKNPRLLRIKEKTLMYKFRIVSIPGSNNSGADALSRISPPTDLSTILQDDSIEQSVTAASIRQFTYGEEIPNITLPDIKRASLSDQQYRLLLHYIETGFPAQKAHVDDDIKPFWCFRHELYIVDDLIYIEGRILIPKVLRNALVEQLHIGHQGVNSMRANAKQRFFWPGMGSQLSLRRAQCKRCNEIAPSNRKESTKQHNQPEYPFQMAVCDLFHMAGRIYIVYADRFSAWTEVAWTKAISNAKTICDILRRYFINFGVPEEFSSDGGPPFQSAEISNFFKKWNVTHRLSSAHYPQSNGRAEAAVKHMKRMLTTNIGADGSLDTDSVAKALLLHRNTPSLDIGASPAELLFGRPIRDHLPNPTRFRREWIDLADLRETAMTKRHQTQTKYVPPRDLNELNVGDSVAVQNQQGPRPSQWEKTGTVIEKLPDRQYRVLVDGSRRTSLRNRRFLRVIPNIIRNQHDLEPLPEILETNPASDHSPPVITTTPEGTPATPDDDTSEAATPPPLQNAPTQQHLTDAPRTVSLRRSTRTKRAPERFKDYVME